MKKVLVAGASGYLGKHVVREFKERGYWIRAFVRNPDKLKVVGPFLEPAVDNMVDEVYTGDVTKPETIKGVCEDIDIVFSSIGVTKPGEKAGFMDVDYRGNKNLLDEAVKESAEKFIFISVYRARDFLYIEGLKAKEMFVDELIKSGLDYVVIRPTGFFSDMTEFLDMAIKGRIYIIGDGENRINPIHGADLAKVCVDSVECDEKEVDVGGPEIFRYIEIAHLAFEVLGKKPRITKVPVRLVNILARLIGLFNKKYCTLIQFFSTAMTHDFIAPETGEHRLRDYYLDILRYRDTGYRG